MSKKHYLGVDDIRPIYGEEDTMWSTAVDLEGIKEMTVEEISEVLGYNVKIVGKKEQA